ncbi:MAG: Stk1 family PASTA domain-containing Ser/Thr kinase [Oscillospiraceae bacterium]|nr:Stk1 family PASTA domain-containing Ser/Thr kinase [Oscillospiraceae bacterium]
MNKYLGKRLEGRYAIQELIGTGGMSNVYKAYDIIDGRDVAVKILRDEFLENDEFLRRFKNESKAIAVMAHPNIVRVYDVSFTSSMHYIVMEYIDGITLKDYIERQNIVRWREAVHFSLQILRALQHAHDKGIVHRDIKPHNIMLLENGEIKVTDFGIARFARSEVRTITDRAIGSVHYISPEQAMGDNTDEKSDIYSVGVMLFEMLTGRLPFEADTAVSVAIKQIQAKAALPRSINPDIPEGLEDITVRAMQKDASKRYRSAAEMIADIELFKQNPDAQFQYKYMDRESEAAKQKKYSRTPKSPSSRTAKTPPAPKEPQEELMPRRKKTPYIPMLTGVTLAFVIASLSFIGMMIMYNNPFVQVEDEILPDFIGLKFDTITAMYSDKYEIISEESEHNEDYGIGLVFSQRPRANTPVKQGSTVRVSVSLGPRTVSLPNFEGRDAMQTFARLRDLGITYKDERMFSDSVPIGSVVYTNPSRDTVVGATDVVTVYVSRGPEARDVDVPNLEGLNVENAQRLLEMAGLRLGEVMIEPSDKPTGTIISQEPGSGRRPEGTAIDVVISEETMRRYTISIPLPEVDRMITIRARSAEGNSVMAEATLNPLEEGIIWNPTFSIPMDADMGEEILITTYIDQRRYIEYYLNLYTGRFREGRNRSDSEDFR